METTRLVSVVKNHSINVPERCAGAMNADAAATRRAKMKRTRTMVLIIELRYY